MCILIYKYFRNNQNRLILGFNRDEVYSRKWMPPSFHWDKGLFGCRDILSSGSWMVTNSLGIIACLLNLETMNSKNKISRGKIPLLIHSCNSLYEATIKIKREVDPRQYNGFVLYLFDRNTLFQISNSCKGRTQDNLSIKHIRNISGIISKYGVNSNKIYRGKGPLYTLSITNWFDEKAFCSFKDEMVNQGNIESQMILRDKLWGTTSSIAICLSKDKNLAWDYSNNLSKFNRTLIKHNG